MRTRIIIRYVGLSLIMVAFMMALSTVVAIMNGHDDSASPLIISTVITLITGAFPMIFVRQERYISPNEGIAIVVISWMACCIFGMIPYICYGGEFTLINAFFESVSGFTTTGASILDNIEALPHGLLFWRTSTAWVGGLGIVSFFSLIIPRSRDTRSVLSQAELSDIARSQSSKRGKAFVKTMLAVYITLTMTCALSLRAAGQDWFDAITNAMSTCSTCGFCVRNTSIAAYGNMFVEIVILFFMTLSGVSFMSLVAIISGKNMGDRRISTTMAAFLVFLATATLIITINLHMNGEDSWAHSMRIAAFQVSSITTTTGFATADTTAWPPLSIMILVIASIICGCSGSTSGGIKMDRAVLLFTYIRNSIASAINPNRVMGTRIDGRLISERSAMESMKFILVYASLIVLGALLNMFFGLDIETGMSAAIACIGNVGPGFGSVGSMGSYSDFPSVLKFTNALLMIAGRLEIFPILAFIGLRSRR